MLYPSEIDLTGVVRQDDALNDVIGDAIGEARADGVLPDWGARTIARALANECHDPLNGALHHFAVTGRFDPAVLADELIDLDESHNDPELHERVFWLDMYVASKVEAARRADVNVEAPSPLVDQGVAEHGDAFRAFLRLPDTNAAEDDLLECFTDFYLGVYDSMDAIMADLALGEVTPEDEAQWAAEGVTRDELVRATWDIVEIDGKLYVFTK